MSLVPVLILFQLLVGDFNPYLVFTAFGVFIYLAILIPGDDSRERPTAFYSSLVNRNIVYGYNHFSYIILMTLMVINGFGHLFTT